MHNLRPSFFMVALALVTAWSTAAFADVAPPDACSGGAGTACNNAGDSSDQPGICVETTCPHGTPQPDGGVVTTENPCTLCELTDAGASSTSSSSSGGATPSGGCAVSVATGQRATAGLMLVVGLGLLASRRRRRGQGLLG